MGFVRGRTCGKEGTWSSGSPGPDTPRQPRDPRTHGEAELPAKPDHTSRKGTNKDNVGAEGAPQPSLSRDGHAPGVRARGSSTPEQAVSYTRGPWAPSEPSSEGRRLWPDKTAVGREVFCPHKHLSGHTIQTYTGEEMHSPQVLNSEAMEDTQVCLSSDCSKRSLSPHKVSIRQPRHFARGPLASVEGRSAPAPGARGLSEQRAGQEGRGVEGTPHPGPGVRTRTPFLQGRRLWERGRAGVISGAGPRLPCLSPGHAEDGWASGGKAAGPRRGCWKPPGGHLPLLCFQGHLPSPSRRPVRMAITTLSFKEVLQAGLERCEKLSFNSKSGRRSRRAVLQDRHWHGGNTQEQGAKEAVQEDSALPRSSSTGGSIRQPHVCLKWGRDRRRLLDAHPPSPDSLQQEGRNGALETGTPSPAAGAEAGGPRGTSEEPRRPRPPRAVRGSQYSLCALRPPPRHLSPSTRPPRALSCAGIGLPSRPQAPQSTHVGAFAKFQQTQCPPTSPPLVSPQPSSRSASPLTR